MNDKTLGIIALGLSAASKAFIAHNQTADFYAAVFFVVGAYLLVAGELRQRRS